MVVGKHFTLLSFRNWGFFTIIHETCINLSNQYQGIDNKIYTYLSPRTGDFEGLFFVMVFTLRLAMQLEVVELIKTPVRSSRKAGPVHAVGYHNTTILEIECPPVSK